MRKMKLYEFTITLLGMGGNKKTALEDAKKQLEKKPLTLSDVSDIEFLQKVGGKKKKIK